MGLGRLFLGAELLRRDAVHGADVDFAGIDQRQQGVGRLRIELGAPAPLNLSQHIIEVHLLPVYTAGGHSVKGVGHADDPAVEGDVFPFEALGIAPAVIALMMILGALHHMGYEGKVLEDFGALRGMALHDSVFLIRQAAGLFQHAVRNADLADIMHEGGPADVFAILPGQAELFGNHGGVGGNPRGMLVGFFVLGVHGAGDGEDRLVRHFDFQIGLRQLPVLPLLDAEEEEHHDPDDQQPRKDAKIDEEDRLIIEGPVLGQTPGPLRQDVLLVIFKDGQMEGIVPGGQVGIGNGFQRGEGKPAPAGVKALQPVSHGRILDGIIQHLGEKLDAGGVPLDGNIRRPLHGKRFAVDPDLGNGHPIGFGGGDLLIRVENVYAVVAGKVQISGGVAGSPGVGGQGAVQPPAGIQQLIGQILPAGKQLIPVHHIDAGAAKHHEGIRIPEEKVVIVEIGEVVQRTDGKVLFHKAQAVAGYQEDAAGFGIHDRPQDDTAGQPVRPGQHAGDLSVFQNSDAVSVSSGQDAPVGQLRRRQDHGIAQTVGTSDGTDDLVVFQEADAVVTAGQNRSVPELEGHPGPVAQAAVFLIIDIAVAIGGDLDHTAAIGTDPQAAVSIDHQAADAGSGQGSGKVAFDPGGEAFIDDVQPLVRPDIVGPPPMHDRVDHLGAEAGHGIDIPELGRRHAQEPQPGGGEPQIPLIIHQHPVDGGIEIIGIDQMELPLGGQEADAAVGRDEDFPAGHGMEILQHRQGIAGPGFQPVEEAAGNIVDIDFAGGGSRQEPALRVEGTGSIDGFPIRNLAGGKDFSFLHEEDPPVIGHHRHMAPVIRRRIVGIIDFPQGADGFQPAGEGHDLQTGSGSDVIISVGALRNDPDGIGGEPLILGNHVDDLFPDQDRKTAVVGSDPETALFVHEKAVHRPDGIVLVHPLEFLPVIPVKPGIGSDPEDAVVGLGDIVGLAAGQAVFAAVYRLDIVIIEGGVLRPGGGSGQQAAGEGDRRQQGQGPGRGGDGIGFLIGRSAGRVGGGGGRVRIQTMEERIEQYHQQHGDGFIHHFQGKLAQEPGDAGRHAIFQQQGDDAVSPGVSRRPGIEEDVEDQGNHRTGKHGPGAQKHIAVHVHFAAPAARPSGQQGQHYAGHQIDHGDLIDDMEQHVSRHAQHGSDHGPRHIGAEHRSHGIQPEEGIPAGRQFLSPEIQPEAQEQKQDQPACFPIRFHAVSSLGKENP